MRTIERNRDSELEPKLLTPASRDNGIKTNFVVVFGHHKGPKWGQNEVFQVL